MIPTDFSWGATHLSSLIFPHWLHTELSLSTFFAQMMHDGSFILTNGHLFGHYGWGHCWPKVLGWITKLMTPQDGFLTLTLSVNKAKKPDIWQCYSSTSNFKGLYLCELMECGAFLVWDMCYKGIVSVCVYQQRHVVHVGCRWEVFHWVSSACRPSWLIRSPEKTRTATL